MGIKVGSGTATPVVGRAQQFRSVLVLLLGLFFLSGFSALAYQTVWQRMLGAFAGSDSVATTIIVGAFLFGLGIGSLIGAFFADRLSLRGALRAFAFCEIGVGVFACFSRTVFYDLFLGELASLAGEPLSGGVIIILALLPPTALMGMSLPLLSRIVVDRIQGASVRIGWLYGLNTLGAAAGALLTGWILIGTLGFAVTVYAAAIINFLIGGTALFASGQLASSQPNSIGRMTQSSNSETHHRLLPWSLMVFISGFLAISLEIVWFRVLGTLMHTDAYAFSLILGVFLLGDGLGVIAGAEVAPALIHPRRAFQLLQGAMGLYALVSLAAVFTLDAHTGLWLFKVGHFPSIRHVVAITFPIVLPPAFLLGMSFPITQRAIQDDPAMVGRRVGLVQLCNILGNTAGAVVTGLVLLQWLGTAFTLRLIGVGSLAFVFIAFVDGWRWHSDGALIVALAALIAIFPRNAVFWSALHGTTAEDAIVFEDRTGIAVLRLAGSSAQTMDSYSGSMGAAHDTLFIAGHAQSRVPFLAGHGALGILAAILHPNPRNIFIIGQGTGGTPIAAGVSPKTRNIQVVDIVAPVFDVMQQAALRSGEDVLHKPLRDYYADPHYTRIVADARHLLLTQENRYDIIEADAIYPTTALAGQLYSTNFFRLALNRLKPGGYVVQWKATDRTLASFLRVFPYVVCLNDFALIGSASPIEITYERLIAELAGPAGEYLAKMGWNRNEVAAKLTSGVAQTWTPHTPRDDRDVNSDAFPKDEYYWNSYKIELIGEDRTRSSGLTADHMSARR
jgi:spermidine synthase